MFACYGVVILGIFIGIIGHAVSETQAQAVRKLKRGRQKHLLRALFQSHRRVDSPVQWEQHESILGQHATLLEDATGVCRAELPEILVVVLLAYILGVREGWSLTSTMYFAIMSASTTGYGDYTPKTQIDKLYCIFFLPLSVAEVYASIRNATCVVWILIRYLDEVLPNVPLLFFRILMLNFS